MTTLSSVLASLYVLTELHIALTARAYPLHIAALKMFLLCSE